MAQAVTVHVESSFWECELYNELTTLLVLNDAEEHDAGNLSLPAPLTLQAPLSTQFN
jgi:hypothetical protein